MKRNIIRISALAIILCMMAVAFMPNTVFAAGTTGKAIQLVDSDNPTGGISDQDHVYFGLDTSATNCFNAYWRVLDAKKANNGNSGMFLLAEELVGDPSTDAGGIRFNNASSKGNAWQGSDAQAWCNTFLSNSFSKSEKVAIMATTKSDSAYTYTDKEYDYSVDFKASDNILNGDKIFFLSAEEADSEAYGFTNNASRKKTFADKTYGYWWLRSPDADHDIDAGLVYYNGEVYDFNVKSDIAARPAFNLDLSSVLFTSAAEGGKSSNDIGENALEEVSDYSGNDWKLTLKDDSRKFSAPSNSLNGDVLTIGYSNAATGNNEYISAIIVDKNDVITYYGNLLSLSGEGATSSGTVIVNLSGKYDADKGDKLYLFNEQCNGDKKTDYSSDLVEIIPHTHNYEFQGFTWKGNDTDGYTGAEAAYKCSCGDMIKVIFFEEDIVKETLEPTCEEAGYIKYTVTVSAATAEFISDIQRTDTKTVTLPKLTEGCQITPAPDPVTPFPVPNTGIEAPGHDISLHYIAMLGICVFVTSFFNKKH